MIEYSRLQDPEYFQDILDQIRTSSDMYVLNNLLKMLSIKIQNKQIDSDTANTIHEAVKSRIKTLTGGKQYNNNKKYDNAYSSDYDRGSRDKNMEHNKVLTLNPVKNSVLSKKNGMVSMVFIVASVAATTVMYTLLLIAKFIK